MLSTNSDNATLHFRNWKSVRPISFSTLSISEKKLNATKCRIQHQREKWHCGHNDHSSIDHTIAGITSDLVISPEQCQSLAKGRMMYLADQFLGAEYGK